MHKKLILIRHGNASSNGFGASDYDRVLTPEGAKDAAYMAARIKDSQPPADLILSSPAARALSTAKIFAAHWGMPAEAVQLSLPIYEANVKSLLFVINNLNNNYQSVALVGHNPGLTELTNYLSDKGVVELPTSGIALIQFPFSEWKYLSYQTGTMLLFDYPKNLQ